MEINKAIRQLVHDNIIMEESPRFSNRKNVVKVVDILKAERNREKVSYNHFYQYLNDQSQSIDYAYFAKNWNGNIYMNFWFTKMGNIVCRKPVLVSVEYCDGKLSLLHEDILQLELLKGCKSSWEADMIEEELNSFKKILLVEHHDLLIDTARFGIVNNYNQELNLPTISHEFVVHLANRGLDLSFSSEIFNLANKNFYLTHFYHWDCDTVKLKWSNDFVADSYLGPWNLKTNIPGMKRLITKCSGDKFDRDVGNGIDALCQNLKVDYEKLPKYLQVEVDKVKSLKK